MTVINGIEIDNIYYKTNDIKYAIRNNDPLEEKLNVIIVVSNPCLFAKRYILLKEFVKRIEEEEDHVNLFVVEMVYGQQRFIVTDKKNKNHLQLRTATPLWHKENMINLGVKYLLPANYKAFAWIDADLEFESSTWALDTLKILNGCKDVVQIFSHCVNMDAQKNTLNTYNSLGYSFSKGKPYTSSTTDYWHPGYAWAMTRKAYEKLGGLYDKGILGSGDNVMALSFLNRVDAYTKNTRYTEDYRNSMLDYQLKAKSLRLGYTPGIIRHFFHGTKENRKYSQRWETLVKYQFSPFKHVTCDEKGVLIPTAEFSEDFKKDILAYFKERNEDD